MREEDRRNDPLLAPILDSRSEEERNDAMTELLSAHVYPRVDRILDTKFRRSGLSAEHRDDVRGEILLKVINLFHRLTRDREAEPVADFPGYVSVLAFNTFDDFVRRAYPLRTKLKHRLRYALRHEPRLSVWQKEAATVCGLSEWEGSPGLTEITDELDGILRKHGPDLRTLLVSSFEELGQPVEIDTLVTAVARTHNLPGDENAQPLGEEMTRAVAHPIDRLHHMQMLREIWDEICALPLRQRIALLLSARDSAGESVARFLPLTGVATIRQIGETLSISANEFGELWQELPLEDTRIALILQLNRQQVINLRRSARERLARRMRGRDTGTERK